MDVDISLISVKHVLSVAVLTCIYYRWSAVDVDSNVVKKIFNRCIGYQSLLRHKTRILITH